MTAIVGALLAGAVCGGLVVHAAWSAFFDGYRKRKAENLQAALNTLMRARDQSAGS